MRSLNEIEKSIILRMLEKKFQGHEQLIKQIPTLQVVKQFSDGDPSIEILVENKKRNYAHVRNRIPVEAEGIDLDGVKIHFLLHVIHGFISELEIYREDSKPIRSLPALESLEIITLFD